MALQTVLDRAFPSEDPDEQHAHFWAAIILVLMVLSLVVMKTGFGARAI